MAKLGEHVVVLGASISGLLACQSAIEPSRSSSVMCCRPRPPQRTGDRDVIQTPPAHRVMSRQTDRVGQRLGDEDTLAAMCGSTGRPHVTI
jgi:hypothetical protein